MQEITTWSISLGVLLTRRDKDEGGAGVNDTSSRREDGAAAIGN